MHFVNLISMATWLSKKRTGSLMGTHPKYANLIPSFYTMVTLCSHSLLLFNQMVYDAPKIKDLKWNKADI